MIPLQSVPASPHLLTCKCPCWALSGYKACESRSRRIERVLEEASRTSSIAHPDPTTLCTGQGCGYLVAEKGGIGVGPVSPPNLIGVFACQNNVFSMRGTAATKV